MFKPCLYTFFFAAVLPFVLSCSNVQSKQNTVRIDKPAGGIHVVELFTSEGCSSCPPADKLLSKLKAEGDSNVFVLSYHVDYWDRLGWKDPFSQAAFTDRQRQYAQRLSLESTYTPQMIVNGEEEFVGSDENKLRTALVKPTVRTVTVEGMARRTANDKLQISYSLSSASGLLLNAALVQSEATSDVKRGENGGRTLRHVNVVRELKTTEAMRKGMIDFSLPADLQKMKLSLLVFVQEKGSGKINGATQLAVPLPSL